MHKAELDRILEQDSGPITPHLQALANELELPSLAIAISTARIEEAAPALMNVLAKAASGDALSESGERLLFRGLHLLGGARRPEAFAPLMRLLRRPKDEVESLLGDAITETLPAIVAGVFNDDAASLFAAIEDTSLDEFIRAALLGAAAFLTWDKRIEREETRQFLERFFESKAAPPEDFAWTAWVEAIGLLGERGLADYARAAFQQGLISAMVMNVTHFEDAFAEAERAPGELGRFQRANLGYIEDVLSALAPFPEEFDAGGFDMEEALVAPLINPQRHVGRNDPCPCGSGRKFKKCCLD